MMASIEKFLATPVGGMFRIFVGLVLGYLVLDLSNDGQLSVSWDELATWIAGALVVVIPLAIAWINPADSRFGRTGE